MDINRVLETLRKYPPGALLVRKSVKSYTFSCTNVTIPAGTRVFIPVYAIHHDERYYPQPDEFDPERFDPETEKARHPMINLGFGNGPRNCIGQLILNFLIYKKVFF